MRNLQLTSSNLPQGGIPFCRTPTRNLSATIRSTSRHSSPTLQRSRRASAAWSRWPNWPSGRIRLTYGRLQTFVDRKCVYEATSKVSSSFQRRHAAASATVLVLSWSIWTRTVETVLIRQQREVRGQIPLWSTAPYWWHQQRRRDARRCVPPLLALSEVRGQDTKRPFYWLLPVKERRLLPVWRLKFMLTFPGVVES